jgi:hypothetical protein
MFFVDEGDTNRSKGQVKSEGGNYFYYREAGGITQKEPVEAVT